MKRFLLFFFSLLITSLQLFAFQTIRGKIIDSGSGEPLDYVNIALLKSTDQSQSAGVVSDKTGRFEVPDVDAGNYILKLSFVGYNTIQVPLEMKSQVLDMGLIKMVEDHKTLSEVEVVGQGTQMKIDLDKKVFSVDKNIASAGGSASEVLQNIPSVNVDNEGNVSLRNSGNVEVWINGKPAGLDVENRAQILQQMPAESIQQVEVITNPSAKFNPEGTSGIINIVLKKDRKGGYFGSLSAGTMWSQNANPGPVLGANINYSDSKIDSYLNLGYRQMNFNGGTLTDRYALNQGDTTFFMHSYQNMDRSFNGLFLRGGIDYKFDTQRTLTLGGFGMLGSGSGTTVFNNQFTNHQTNTLTRDYVRTNYGVGTRPHLHLNLDYKYDIDQLGSNFIASLSYSNHNRTDNSTYLTVDKLVVDTSYIRQLTGGSFDEWMLKMDYVKKFNANSRIETGIQSTISNRLSPNSATDLLNNKEIKSYYDIFDYKEQIHAAYFTYGGKWKNLSAQAGLRGEYYVRDPKNTFYDAFGSLKTEIYTLKPDFQLFPSMFLGYSLPKQNEIQLNYSRRVNRPRGRQINPFRDYSDITNINYGNLELNPEYTNSLELNYIKTWEEHMLSASLYHRITENVIQDVRFMHNNFMESSYMNVSNARNTGLELVAKDRIFKFINLTSTFNFYRGALDSSSYLDPYNADIRIFVPGQESFSWSARIMANFMLGKNTSGQIVSDYASPRVIAQGKETASYALDLGLRQTMLDKNLNISLMARDIFNTRRRNVITSGVDFSQISKSYFNGRMLGLTVTYNFGNMKAKKPKSTEGSSMEGGMEE